VVVIAKFSEGAWMTVIMIPGMLTLMYRVRRHYDKLLSEIATRTPLEPVDPLHPLIAVTLQDWTRVGKEALRVAMTLSNDIRVIHVAHEDKPNDFCERWSEYVLDPAKNAGLPVPELVVLKSPYRFVVAPIVDYVIQLAAENPNRRVVTVVPELMERRWYYYFLHNQRAALLKTQLLMKGNDRISVLNIPWYLKSE
jgi:hypothetical protein